MPSIYLAGHEPWFLNLCIKLAKGSPIFFFFFVVWIPCTIFRLLNFSSLGYKNCKKSNFSIRYTSRLNRFHTHIIYMEREREREYHWSYEAVSLLGFVLLRACGYDNVFSLIYIYIYIYANTFEVHLGESIRGCAVFFLKQWCLKWIYNVLLLL